MIDAVLWSLAIALLALALWLGTRGEPRWDPALYFTAVLRAIWGVPPPVSGVADLPGEVPPELAPARRLGPGLDWSDVAAWTPAVEAAIRRRLANVTLVWFETPAFDVPGVETRVLPGTEGVDEALESLLARADARVIVVAKEAASSVLALLADAPMLRDRLRAALFVGATPDAAWLAAHFDHAHFDVEVDRAVPYLSLRLPGTEALPDPPEPPTARRSIASIDLGEVDPAALPDPRLARAIAALLASMG